MHAWMDVWMDGCMYVYSYSYSSWCLETNFWGPEASQRQTLLMKTTIRCLWGELSHDSNGGWFIPSMKVPHFFAGLVRNIIIFTRKSSFSRCSNPHISWWSSILLGEIRWNPHLSFQVQDFPMKFSASQDITQELFGASQLKLVTGDVRSLRCEQVRKWLGIFGPRNFMFFFWLYRSS